MRAILPRSLTTRLSLAVFGLSFGVATLGAWALYRTASTALRERVRLRLESDAGDEAQRATEWLSRQQALVALEAAQWSRANDSIAALSRSGDSLATFRPMLGRVLEAEELQQILVPGGLVVRSTNPASVGRYAVDEEFYQFGRDTLYTQRIYHNAVTGRPRLTVAAPIKRNGKTVALIAAHLDLTRLESAVAHPRSLSLSTDAYFVDRFSGFVSAQRFGREGILRGVRSEAIDGAIGGASGAGFYEDYRGRAVVGAWRWIPELDLALIVETPQQAALAPARTLLTQTLLLGLIATALLALGVTAIARRFTTPVLKVAAAAARVAAGDFGVRTVVSSDDEVGTLAQAFNVMTERLESLYRRLESQVEATQQALVAAQASRELLQDLMNNSTTLVMVVGLDDRIMLANARAAMIAGIPSGAAEGQLMNTVFGESAEAMRTVIERSRGGEGVTELEVILDSPAGARGWQLVAFPLLRHDGTPYATGLIGTDLTERARAEAERRARDASVQQAQKLESLGVMAGGIAHDFNNILGAIIGNAELARDSRNMEEVGQSLDRIVSSGRRAAELTRQMLAYAGRASLRRETVDARQVIADIVPIVRASQSKKAQLEVGALPEPLWIELDPAQLSQVLLNLLTNAAEAVGDQAGMVRLHASDNAPPDSSLLEPAPHGWIQLTVEDTGPGIPETVRARIFDPFFTTKSSGRGLGLSAVRGIVNSLDGVLTLTRTGPSGTRFDIYLRRASSATTAPGETTAGNITQHSGTLLVVDDEAPIRDVAARVSRRMGLRVVEAEDGKHALAQFAAHADEISVVLLDLTMPGMGGAEVLAELRTTHPDLPVIIASGYDRDDALADIGDDPAVRFLPKPFDASALRQHISDAMQTRPATP